MTATPKLTRTRGRAASSNGAAVPATGGVVDPATLPDFEAQAETTRIANLAAGIASRIAKHGDDIRHLVTEVDAQRADGGFASAMAAAEALGLTAEELAEANPNLTTTGTPSPVTLAIVAAHDAVGEFHGPTFRATLSRALRCAVNCLPLDVARDARTGNGTAEKAEFAIVPVPSHGNATGAIHATQDAAKAEVSAEYDKAKAAWDAIQAAAEANGLPVPNCAEKAIFQQWEGAAEAWRAADDGDDKAAIDTVRVMARRVNTSQANASRWLGSVYLPLVRETIEAYVKSDPVKPIGSMWQTIGTVARAAHKAAAKAAAEAKVKLTAEALDDAIQTAVQNRLLEELKIIRKADKPLAAQIAAAKAGLFQNLFALERLGALGDEAAAATAVDEVAAILERNGVRDPGLEREEEKAAKEAARAKAKAEKDAARAKAKAEKEAADKAKAEADKAAAEKAKGQVAAQVDDAVAAQEAAANARGAKFKANLKAKAATPKAE